MMTYLLINIFLISDIEKIAFTLNGSIPGF